jgi:hypothetical protein
MTGSSNEPAGQVLGDHMVWNENAGCVGYDTHRGWLVAVGLGFAPAASGAGRTARCDRRRWTGTVPSSVELKQTLLQDIRDANVVVFMPLRQDRLQQKSAA